MPSTIPTFVRLFKQRCIKLHPRVQRLLEYDSIADADDPPCLWPISGSLARYRTVSTAPRSSCRTSWSAPPTNNSRPRPSQAVQAEVEIKSGTDRRVAEDGKPMGLPQIPTESGRDYGKLTTDSHGKPTGLARASADGTSHGKPTGLPRIPTESRPGFHGFPRKGKPTGLARTDFHGKADRTSTDSESRRDFHAHGLEPTGLARASAGTSTDSHGKPTGLPRIPTESRRGFHGFLGLHASGRADSHVPAAQLPPLRHI